MLSIIFIGFVLGVVYSIFIIIGFYLGVLWGYEHYEEIAEYIKENS